MIFTCPPIPGPILLLHPNIPKPLHGVNPRTILGQLWWDKTRKEAYGRYFNLCAACGEGVEVREYSPWLEAHEIYEIDYPKGRATYLKTEPLCRACHMFIHSGRTKMLADSGEISQKDCTDILRRGDKLLKEAGLKKEKTPNDIAPWSDWRLILEGKEYPPIFINYDEWEQHYCNQ